MKYRKKPVEVDAFRIGIDPIPDWAMDKVTDGTIILRSDTPEDCHIEQRKEYDTWCEIDTPEGVMKGDTGDWIIKESHATNRRTVYPCKPDIFKATYDKVEEDMPVGHATTGPAKIHKPFGG